MLSGIWRYLANSRSYSRWDTTQDIPCLTVTQLMCTNFLLILKSTFPSFRNINKSDRLHVKIKPSRFANNCLSLFCKRWQHTRIFLQFCQWKKASRLLHAQTQRGLSSRKHILKFLICEKRNQKFKFPISCYYISPTS